MLESFLRILDRQGILKDDLNEIQRSGLMWLMRREMDDKLELERIRTENMAIAANPNANPKFIQFLKQRRDEEEEGIEADLAKEGYEVEWFTPTSTDEVQDVLTNLGLSAR